MKHNSRYAAKVARRKKGGPIHFGGEWPFNVQTWLDKYNYNYKHGQQQKASFNRIRRADELV